MKVLKFGGTSVGSPDRIKNVAKIVQDQAKEDNVIVVLSAVSGTTNKLIRIVCLLKENKKEKASQAVINLKSEYNTFIENLLHKDQLRLEALSYLEKSLQVLKSTMESDFDKSHESLIIAQGELLSTQLFYLFLKERHIKPNVLPALNFIKLDKNDQPDNAFIQKELEALLMKQKANIYITQGFICRNNQGDITNLKRGGSDYSASLIGAAVQADEIQIWTDIDGVHNNDPRFVQNTQPIDFLNFDEAAELAYFGAKILHPQSILPAKNNHIPVRLLNTMEPHKKGTLISDKYNSKGKIVALAAKDHITAIRIESSRMLLAYGFLRKIFDVFEYYKTPIDMISTSEVAVSLTIDDTQNIDKIKEELHTYGKIEVYADQSILCAVGDFGINTHNGHASMIMEALKHIPIRMISYGGSEHNLSLLLPRSYKKEALRALHCRLF